MRVRLWALAGVAFLGSVSPAAATPGDDAYVIQASRIVAAESFADLPLRCEAGDRAIGGGLMGSGGDPFVAVSGPLDASGETQSTDDGDIPRYWYSALFNAVLAPSDPMLVTYYALCSASSDATVQATEIDVPATKRRAAFADCPAGERAVGGGLGSEGDLTGQITRSQPAPSSTTPFMQIQNGDVARGWSAAVAAGNAESYRVFALCSPASTATIEVTRAPVASLVDPTDLSAACPGAQRVVGGGFGGETGARPIATAPSILRGHPNGWVAGLRRGGTAFDGEPAPPEPPTLGAFALCEPPTPAPASAPTETPVGDPGAGIGPGPEGPQADPPLCAETAATIAGSDEAETISGTPGDDVIAGLGGDDKILASAGNDVVCGGTGNDTLKGQRGADLLLGERGRDKLAGGAGRDSCFGGPNHDSNAGSCEKGRA